MLSAMIQMDPKLHLTVLLNVWQSFLALTVREHHCPVNVVVEPLLIKASGYRLGLTWGTV